MMTYAANECKLYPHQTSHYPSPTLTYPHTIPHHLKARQTGRFNRKCEGCEGKFTKKLFSKKATNPSLLFVVLHIILLLQHLLVLVNLEGINTFADSI